MGISTARHLASSSSSAGLLSWPPSCLVVGRLFRPRLIAIELTDVLLIKLLMLSYSGVSAHTVGPVDYLAGSGDVWESRLKAEG